MNNPKKSQKNVSNDPLEQDETNEMSNKSIDKDSYDDNEDFDLPLDDDLDAFDDFDSDDDDDY